MLPGERENPVFALVQEKYFGLGILFAKASLTTNQKLKPRGFVIATGLHKLFSKTAAHVFECLRNALGT